MELKAIFIDIDNTLLDFDAYVRETLREGFQRFGLGTYAPYVYEVFTEINNGLWQEIEQGSLTFEELEKIRFDRIFKRLGIYFDGPTFERHFKEALNRSAIPVDGAGELLDGLAGRYILCTASNGPYDQQIGRLRLAGMEKYFSLHFISERIGASKPDPAFFERAFALLNAGRRVPIRPEECLMLGDSVSSDMAGGHNAGMKTCFYRRDRNRPRPDGVDLVVDDLRDVAGQLTMNNG